MTGLDRRAVAMVAGTVLLVAVTLPLAAPREQPFDTVLYATLPMILGVVGTLIASRRPDNLIGWLFCGMALWGAVAELGEAYGHVAAERGLRGGVAGEWLISWSWIVYVAALVVVVLLFPDGRLPGRRWRRAIWISLAGAVLLFVGQAFNANQTVGFSSGRNPLGLDSPWVDAAMQVGIALLITALAAAVASSVLRYRRAGGVERQQLKWFAYAGVTLALVAAVASVFWYRSVLVQALVGLAFNAMPVAVGVAILRYRLYDLDVLINRTLVYATLTATLAGAYQASVLLLQLALRPLIADSDLAVAGSTLAVAALFRPARARIQAAVDRRFYRRRYDAARTLEHLAVRLRDEVDLRALQADVCAAVSDSLQPARVSLWLRVDGAGRWGARRPR